MLQSNKTTISQSMLVQIPNSHSLGLKTVNKFVTGVEEITPEQSSLSLTTSLKLFITQCKTTVSVMNNAINQGTMWYNLH